MKSNIVTLRREKGQVIRETELTQRRNERREQIWTILVHPLLWVVVFVAGWLLFQFGAKSIGAALGLHDTSFATPGVWTALIVGPVLAVIALIRAAFGDPFRAAVWHLLGGK